MKDINALLTQGNLLINEYMTTRNRLVELNTILGKLVADRTQIVDNRDLDFFSETKDVFDKLYDSFHAEFLTILELPCNLLSDIQGIKFEIQGLLPLGRSCRTTYNLNTGAFEGPMYIGESYADTPPSFKETARVIKVDFKRQA